jgi:parallel beta-helix repeat protein
MTMNTSIHRLSMSSAALLLLSTLNPQLSTCFAQGPLTPPGAPAPTMKTLDQVAPRTAISSIPFSISASGSYYLTASLSTNSGSGITITADNVTVDLNGFALAGAPGSVNGIFVSGVHNNIVIENGVVSSWGTAGFSMFNARNSCVRNVQVFGNGTAGISFGSYGRVEGCTSSSNGTTGFIIGFGSVVKGCTAATNGGTGFMVDDGSAVIDCTATDNTLLGINAYDVNSVTGTLIQRCAVHGNDGGGIAVGAGGGVINCSVVDSTGSTGIFGAAGVYISGCIVRTSGSIGIDVTTLATVASCTVTFSTTDGIRAASDCLILQNQCISNGNSGDGAGVHATGSRNRIEGNNARGNDRGIDIDGTTNLVIRNTASANTTNYDVVANNKVGPTVSAPNSAAFTGDTGGSGVGSTDPWANFTY